LDFDQDQPSEVPATVGFGIIEDKVFGFVEEGGAEGVVAGYVSELVEHVVRIDIWLVVRLSEANSNMGDT